MLHEKSNYTDVVKNSDAKLHLEYANMFLTRIIYAFALIYISMKEFSQNSICLYGSSALELLSEWETSEKLRIVGWLSGCVNFNLNPLTPLHSK